MKDLDSRISLIRKKIELIASRSSKKICLNPPISEREIVKFEQYYQITFPSEYRAFLTNIANGGFGLNRGLLSLEDSLKYFHNVKQDNYIKQDLLRIPFTHTSTYNPDEDPYILELGEKCDRGEIPESECDRVYDYLIAGTMAISMEGCGYYSFIVITGLTRGQVWFNADVSDGGYIPLNLSFLDWYEKWLDERL